MKTSFPFKQICVGGVLLALETAAVCGLAGLLTVKEVLPESAAAIPVHLLVLLLAFLTALRTARQTTNRKMQTALCVGAVFLVICFFIGLLLGGAAQWKLWPLLALAVCALAGILASAKKTYRR